jgi:undecaprenyl-diphosphatase
MTIFFGILLYISDRNQLQNQIEDNLNYKSALIIGLFQVLSLIPGVSRSGITITAGRLLKFKRYDAAKISFLLSIPTLGAVSLFGLGKIITSSNINLSMLNFTAIILSFFFSFITIKFFLQFLKKFNLTIFVFYRLILGTVLLFVVYL